MRKIIFRAKKVSDNEWVLGGYVQAIQTDKETGFNKDKHFIMESNGLANEIDPETVCQYAGVRDRFGNEIFEGDVVSALFTGYDGKARERKGVVEFVNSAFSVNWYDSEDCGKNFVGYVNDIEVVGNTF